VERVPFFAIGMTDALREEATRLILPHREPRDQDVVTRGPMELREQTSHIGRILQHAAREDEVKFASLEWPGALELDEATGRVMRGTERHEFRADVRAGIVPRRGLWRCRQEGRVEAIRAT